MGGKRKRKNNDKTEREVRKYREGNEVKQNRKKRKWESSWLKEGTEEKRKNRKRKEIEERFAGGGNRSGRKI